MELEPLFTSTKWEILQALARRPQSPLQIADMLGTSIANISMQIRLLEASGLVVKERTGESEAGKPRFLYSLRQEFAYVVLASHNGAFKFKAVTDTFSRTSLAVMQLPIWMRGFVLKMFMQEEELLSYDVFIAEQPYMSSVIDVVIQGKPSRSVAKDQKLVYNKQAVVCKINVADKRFDESSSRYVQVAFATDKQVEGDAA